VVAAVVVVASVVVVVAGEVYVVVSADSARVEQATNTNRNTNRTARIDRRSLIVRSEWSHPTRNPSWRLAGAPTCRRSVSWMQVMGWGMSESVDFLDPVGFPGVR
jgi:hypothetical protein